MSYETENTFPSGTRAKDIKEFIQLLGYERQGAWGDPAYGSLEVYAWFEVSDYKSWSGVTLAIQHSDGKLAVETRTPIGRSYHDLVHQNNTASALKKRFGGEFRSDMGKGRYLRPEHPPPPPPASGCHLAFTRLGSNLIKAFRYLDTLTFPNLPPRRLNDPLVSYLHDPRVLSESMLISFSVSLVEDYLKSCFVALLRYSPNKESFLRGIRLHGDHLARISSGNLTVEDAVSETLSFQLSVVRTFGADPGVD